MSLARPKRKATNRAYNETLDESIFEERPNPTPASKTNGTTARKRSAKKDDASTSLSTPESSTTTNGKTVTNMAANALPYNWQPCSDLVDHFSHRLNLEGSFVDEETQTLYCPNQSPIPMSYESPAKRRKGKTFFKLQKHDFIYMVSEPPGEPYYIGSIMGFEKRSTTNGGGSVKAKTKESAPVANPASSDASNYVFKIQWFYRPRDISKSTSDSRLLYASMHTDTCPLQSFRGLVTVRHKQDIENEYETKTVSTKSSNGSSKSSSPSPITPLEEYSQQPNCFYFNQLFDRYMVKFYDIILTQSLLFNSDNAEGKNRNFLQALNKRFEYVFVETTMTKSFVNSFLSTSCNCEKCGQWCSNQDSVNCVGCEKTYHMYCLDPPLFKKPSRGFSWSCAPCTKQHDLEHQKNKMLMLSHDNKLSNERELTGELSSQESSLEDEDEGQDKHGYDRDSGVEEIEKSESIASNGSLKLPKFEAMAIEFLKKDSKLTLEQRRIKEEWNMRYLGMYARLEDGVDVDDRSPYPRAQTRLGAKHQAMHIPEYIDHPIVYYDPEVNENSSNNKKKSKKNSKTKKDTAEDNLVKLPVPKEYQDVPESEYPQWLQPRPAGYIERGVDDGEGTTATLLFKPSELDRENDFIKLDAYVLACSPLAKKMGLLPTTPNFMDAILYFYMKHNGQLEESFKEAAALTRESLREPTFTDEEVTKFEEGVRKYGSELYPTFKEVKTQPCAMIVRFYYLWKKTPNGRQIWGNFEGRIQKKIQNVTKEETNKPAVPTEIDHLACADDDSAYEGERIKQNKTHMACKHCYTTQSMIWYRITGFDANTKIPKGSYDKIDKNSTLGLCFRCARMWRRYAVLWEDPLEVRKKNTRGAGGWKKKVEYELVRDSEKILEEADRLGGGISFSVAPATSSMIPMILPGGSTATGSKSKKPAASSTKKSLTAPTSRKVTTPVQTLKSEEPPKKKRNTGSASANSTTASASEAPNDPKVTADVKVSSGSGKTKLTSNGSATTKSKGNTATNTKTSKQKAPSQVKEKTTTTADKDTKDKKLTKSAVAKSASAKTVKEKSPIKIEGNGDIPKDSKPKRKREETTKSAAATSKKKKVVETKPLVTAVEKVGNESNSNGKKSRKTQTQVPKSVSKGSDSLSPNFNKNYVLPIKAISRNEKKGNNQIMTKDSLQSTIELFRPRQLLDVAAQLPVYQIPSGAIIAVPFPVTERNCSLCQEIDEDIASLDEMLICSNCGVNVHASCSGINIGSSVERPAKEWLCEPCINDLNPQYSTLYSCSLCLANEPNYELTMLGSNKVKPDYLKPIADSGKWCHLLCAMFSHQSTSFRSLLNTKRTMRGNQMSLEDGIHSTCSVDCVSQIYLNNYDQKCKICQSANGALIECELCEKSSYEVNKFHATCAQDSDNFVLGFKLESGVISDRDNRLVRVKGLVGKLIPVLVCSSHTERPENIFGFREKGKRVHGPTKDSLKPITQLFLEDILKKSDMTKLSGPQAKANNYLELATSFEEREKSREVKLYHLSNVLEPVDKPFSNYVKRCNSCQTKVSPMWWPVPKVEKDMLKASENVKIDLQDDVLCQSCYHDHVSEEEREEEKSSRVEEEVGEAKKMDAENETLDEDKTASKQSQSLTNILNKSLSGEFFGLKDNYDRLINSSRSKITLGDILG